MLLTSLTVEADENLNLHLHRIATALERQNELLTERNRLMAHANSLKFYSNGTLNDIARVICGDDFDMNRVQPVLKQFMKPVQPAMKQSTKPARSVQTEQSAQTLRAPQFGATRIIATE